MIFLCGGSIAGVDSRSRVGIVDTFPAGRTWFLIGVLSLMTGLGITCWVNIALSPYTNASVKATALNLLAYRVLILLILQLDDLVYAISFSSS